MKQQELPVAEHNEFARASRPVVVSAGSYFAGGYRWLFGEGWELLALYTAGPGQ